MFEDGEKFLEMSKEMYQILETVYNSEFYTADPAEACIFLPSVDLLNTEKTDNKLVSVILSELPYWGTHGRNHLILNIINNGQWRDARDIMADGRTKGPIYSQPLHSVLNWS